MDVFIARLVNLLPY